MTALDAALNASIPSGYTLDYFIDDQGRLSAIADGSGHQLASYAYDASGDVRRPMTNGNGTFTSYSYDSAENISGVTNFRPWRLRSFFLRLHA